MRANAVRGIKRLITFDACQITLVARHGEHTGPKGYDFRVIDGEQFAALADSSKLRAVNHAFARGDECVASLFDGKLVGYNFYTVHADVVAAGVEFSFLGHVHCWNAFTEDEHRGRGLNPARWSAWQRHREEIGSPPPPIVWWISYDNPASLASSRKDGGTPIGFSARWRWTKNGRTHCYRSPGCRKHDIGFRLVAAA